MRVAGEHEFGADGELFDHIGFVPQDDDRVLGVGIFEGGVWSWCAAVCRVDADPLDAVLVVNLVKEKSGTEVFDDGFNLVDISSVVVAISGDNEAFPCENGEVLEGKLKEVAVIRGVAVHEITADDHDVGVLISEPRKGGANEGDGLLIADVEVSNESDSVASKEGGPARDGQRALLSDKAIGFDKMSICQGGGSDSGCGSQQI